MPQTTITLSAEVKRRLRRFKPDDLTWDQFLEVLRESVDAEAFEDRLARRYVDAVRAARGGRAGPDGRGSADLAARLPEGTVPGVRDALGAFLDRLEAEAGDRVERVLLYGSVARGEAREGSDVDVLVVWDGPWDDGYDAVTAIAGDVHAETGVPLSARAVTGEQWDRFVRRGWPFYRTVRREGIRLA